MPSPERALTAGVALRDCLAHPYDRLIRRWNWKSAVLSSIVRALLFFFTNLSAGLDAAMGAAGAELLFRSLTSGFYGAITEAFAPIQPARAALLTTIVVVPLLSQSLEFAVHYLRGTPELLPSVAASAALTIWSTAFNLFAMRNGALIVGHGRQSIAADLCRMPALMCRFAGDLLNVRRWIGAL